MINLKIIRVFCAQVNRLETTIHGMANASNALAECEQHFKSENAKEKSELLTAYKEKLAEKDRLIAAQDEELKVNMSMD